MATALSGDDSSRDEMLQDVVKCSICLETYRDPKTLPCLHSFCLECVTGWVRKKRDAAKVEGVETTEFECPQCREVFIAENDEAIKQFKCIHPVRNMLDVVHMQQQAKESKLTCSQCQEPAVCYCCECEMFLGAECLSLHQAWKAFKEHTTFTLEELGKPENKSKVKRKVYCDKHPKKERKFYCTTCEELICRYCMDKKHSREQHECHPLSDVAEMQRQSVNGHVGILEGLIKQATEALGMLAGNKEQIIEESEKAKKEIFLEEQRILKIITDKVKNRTASLIQVVEEHCKKLSGVVENDESEVHNELERVTGILSLVTNLLEYGNEEEIASSRKMIEENMEKVKDHLDYQRVKHVADASIKYQPQINDDDIKQSVDTLTEKFGNIECQARWSCLRDPPLQASSTILNGKIGYINQMMEWVPDCQWQCVYRASRDGWSGQDFHRKCDGIKPTVTLIKVGDYIFGGYNDQDWTPPPSAHALYDDYKRSDRSFLFSLKNKDDLPGFTAPIKPGQHQCAIISHPSYGPTFGGGYDLCISPNPNTDQSSSSDLGNSYALPTGYLLGDNKAKCLLAGSIRFTPTEIEVFY